jgi:3-oxoacyl-[acyl-carrier-protein] synthase II
VTRVAITGLGAASPFGLTAGALWEGLIAGRPAVRTIERLVQSGIAVTAGGAVPLPPAGAARDLEMSQRPITDALAQAGLTAADTALVWATGLDEFAEVGGELIERSTGACFTVIARAHAWPRRMVATACASATQAIGEAFRLIRAGRVRAAVAGGASVMLSPHYVLAFTWLQALAACLPGEPAEAACKPFDRMRRGLALAEGGAALVLEALDLARARGATVLGEVIGYGSSQDAFDLNRPPPDGLGAELCMRRALDDAALGIDRIGAVNAHGTGTRAGDPAEAEALRRVLGERWRTTPVSSIKGAIGHAMAAAGALQGIAAVQSCASGVVPPTCNLTDPDAGCELDHVIGRARAADVPAILSCSYGMGGQNACVIFARPEEPGPRR